LARSTSDLYRIVSELTRRGVEFKVLDDPSIDTSSRTGKLVMGVLALIAEFENDIRREGQQDGINKAKAAGVPFGPKPILKPFGKTVRQSRKSCGVQSLARPVSIGHLGCNPSRSGLARLDGLTMGICDECGERLIEIEDHPPMLWRLTATTLNSCGRSSMRSAPTMEDSCGC
jgi:hypothetical protein